MSSWQTEEEAGANLPEGQGVGLEDSVGDAKPAGEGKQTAAAGPVA